MLADILEHLEQERNKKFQIIAKVDHLISSEKLTTEPELPYHVKDKINKIDQICRDRLIETGPAFKPERLEFAKEFNTATGSDTFLLQSAIRNNVAAQRLLIDQISSSLRSAKTPRQKNEVKNWATDILKLARSNLTASVGTPTDAIQGKTTLQFDEDTIEYHVEKEIQLIAQKYALQAETTDEIRLAYMMLNKTNDSKSCSIPAFICK